MGGIIGYGVSDFQALKQLRDKISKIFDSELHFEKFVARDVARNRCGRPKQNLLDWQGHGLMISFTTRWLCHNDSSCCWVLLELIL